MFLKSLFDRFYFQHKREEGREKTGTGFKHFAKFVSLANRQITQLLGGKGIHQ